MIQRRKHAAVNGGYCWFATQGYYLGRAAAASSQSMSLWHVGPIGPDGNPHIGSPPAHGSGTGNIASNNHPGARYRRYRKGMANSTAPSPPHLPRNREAEAEYGAGSCPGDSCFSLCSSAHCTKCSHTTVMSAVQECLQR